MNKIDYHQCVKTVMRVLKCNFLSFVILMIAMSSNAIAQTDSNDKFDIDTLAKTSATLYYYCDAKPLALKGYALVSLLIKEDLFSGKLTEKAAIDKTISVWKTNLQGEKGLKELCEPSETLIKYLLSTYSVDGRILSRVINTFKKHMPAVK